MSFHQDFVNIISEVLPVSERDALLVALEREPEVSVRFNPLIPDVERLVLDSLDCISDGRVPWADHAVYLDHRPKFTLDPLLHQGCYYVQEASSMFLEQAVRKCVIGPVKVLDLCAAPGGKSTLLASLLPKGSMLVCNEIQRGRAQILAENMTKWGMPGVVVTCNTPGQIGESNLSFDLIVVDAPCSGEGMFRKDEVAVAEWSARNVEMCAGRQRHIIEEVWPSLKPGGYMIYSTCTFNRYEDEENVRWIIDRFGADAIPLDVNPDWNILGSLSDDELAVYHFMQHRNRGEGFFICLMRKPDGIIRQTSFKPFKSNSSVPVSCRGWLSSEDSFEFDVRGGSVYAFPSDIAADMNQVYHELYALIPGVEIAVRKGNDWIPAHALAMSVVLKMESFNCVEVTRQQALSYLHCDAIHLEDAQRGIVLLTYNNIPLGFAKNLGNRANNMYPKEWRIRMNS